MATDNEEPKKTSFKVVDRRRFHEDGTAREGPDVQQDRPRVDPPIPQPQAQAQAAKPAPQGQPGQPGQQGQQPQAPQAPSENGAAKKPTPEEAPGGLSFGIFVQSLAQQALMQLGLIPWPHGQRELHLEQARDTIDIVQLLKVKTKGNLSAEENQLIDTVLYELKMSWVEVQQAIARSKGAQMPRPPGSR